MVRVGANGFGSAYEKLCNFVDSMVLHDIPLSGSPFTFFGYGQSVACNRLDRFLVSDGTGAWFSILVQKVVVRFVSDHLSITVSSQSFSSGFRPFRFFNVWCQDNSRSSLVESTWEGIDHSLCPFWDKMNRIKKAVSRWQKVNYSSSVNRFKDCERELGALLTGSILANESELELFRSKKQDLSLELHNLKVIEDRCWHQKSRIQWLKEGDLNTSYFHRVASGKRRSSQISPAMLSLSENVNLVILRDTVTESFKQRFTGTGFLHIASWDVDFPRLDEGSATSLEIPFSEDEIFSTIQDANGDKAPGSDGFSLKFGKSFRHVCKDDMLALFHSFYCSREFNPRFSESFIFLIPKVKSPSRLNDF